jgi:hypothetical protein
MFNFSLKTATNEGICQAKHGSPGAVPAELDTGERSTVSYLPVNPLLRARRAVVPAAVNAGFAPVPHAVGAGRLRAEAGPAYGADAFRVGLTPLTVSTEWTGWRTAIDPGLRAVLHPIRARGQLAAVTDAHAVDAVRPSPAARRDWTRTAWATAVEAGLT